MRRHAPCMTLLAVVALACGGEEPDGPGAAADRAAAGPPIEVTRVTLGVDRHAGPQGVFFAPGDDLVARVETRGRAERATLIVDWKGEDGRVIGHSSRSIAPDGVEVTEFHLTHPDLWPEGSYEFEVWLDGRRVVTRRFAVQGDG